MKAISGMRGFLSLIISVSFTIGVFAQELSTASKKAARHYEKAKTLYNNRQNVEALKELSTAIEIDPKFTEAHLLMAGIYSDLHKIDEAIASYSKAAIVNPDFFPPCFFNLGSLELGKGFYNEAKLHFEKFLTYKGMNEKFVKLAARNIKICDFAFTAFKNPVLFNPVNLGTMVNSPDDEYYPAITADDNVLIYTRRIKDRQNYFGEQEDFFVSVRKEGQWTQSFNLGTPINTHYNEGSPTISPDGRIIVFSACEEIEGYGTNRTGYGSCDIFFVKKLGEKWSLPINIGPPISTKDWDVQPSYASDGKTLYFVSQRNGGQGDADIWVSALTDAGVWGAPVNLGPVINTSGKEESVFIHPDNQTLYFASDGHIGMGGLDIFVSKKKDNGEWGEPVNLGYPINTFNDENGLIVDANGDLAYYSSDRDGGNGGLDLYSFNLHEAVRPVRVTYVKGRVYDSQTQKNLKSRFELIDLQTGLTVIESNSDMVTGEFLVCLPVNKNYALNVSKKGYVFFSENFSLKESGESSEPFIMDVQMEAIRMGSHVVLRNIFYETGSYQLKDASKAELGKIISFLDDNPNVKIEISGHTDDVGDVASNQLLSENRAREVYDYLIEKGVETGRLSYKGYGESIPIVSNYDEANRAKNRRTEFKIVSL